MFLQLIYMDPRTNIYIKISKVFKLPNATNLKLRTMYSIKLQLSIYVLRQSNCLQYNCLSEYFLKEGYVINLTFSYIFIKKPETRFTITIAYVDDLNLI